MVALSQAGTQLIARFEGTRLALYNDPGNNCTIGIGHLVHLGPCNGSEPQAFKQGITEQQALDLLTSDAKIATDCITSNVKVTLSQGQADALISFVYNVGCGAFQTSDLLTLLNQGNYAAVPAQLMRWTHGGGVELPGLVLRRQAEGALFAASQQGQGGAMASLPNFPMVSQLTAITSDGRPSENAQYDCVPASIGAAILWFEGKHQWDASINPDLLKDKAYGEALRNSGTAASAYVPFCQSLGYKLFHIDGSPGTLIQEAHTELALGHPVVFTEPDPYVPASYGWSHVCVFFGEMPGELTCLDPYIGKPITRSDAEWQQMLMFNQIWVVERIEETVIIDLNTPGVSNYFEAVPGNTNQWKCQSNGKIIQFGLLSSYRGWGNSGLCGLTFLGLPQSNEIPLSGVPGAVKQHFERGVLFYDPGHKADNPPGSGAVYAAHLYSGAGQDPRVVELQAQITDLEKQLAANPGNATVQQQLDAANQKLAQVKALVV
jgi:GH24 family phage-related lysozyme (muramidase)